MKIQFVIAIYLFDAWVEESAAILNIGSPLSNRQAKIVGEISRCRYLFAVHDQTVMLVVRNK